MLAIWLSSCSSNSAYQLTLDFPDQEAFSWTTSVDIWALPPEPPCAALLSGTAVPSTRTSHARLQIEGPPTSGTRLSTVPFAELLFFVQVLGLRSTLLRGCVAASIGRGEDVEVVVPLRWRCSAEIPDNFVDDDCDGQIDECCTGSGAFAGSSAYAVGQTPSDIVAADLDSDGDSDLVTANTASNTLSILLNEHQQGVDAPWFATAVPLRVPAAPRAVRAADFNRDGNQDLASSHETSGEVHIWLGNGSGIAYSAAFTLSIGGTPIALHTDDLDRDGAADLIVARYADNALSVLRNLGDGQFSVARTLLADHAPEDLTSCDLNGDGRPDLLSAGGGSVCIWTAEADFEFSNPTCLPLGTEVQGLACANVNRDGVPDILAVDDANGSLIVLMADPTREGAFLPSKAFSIATGAEAVQTADFDGDGLQDVAVAADNDGAIAVLLNRSAVEAAFEAPVLYSVGSEPESLVATDLNGDGSIDLASGNASGNEVGLLAGAASCNTCP